MSDIILNIKLTETEVIHITDALHARIDDLNDALTFAGDPVIQDQIAELTELLDDLREQCARHDDGWNNPEDPDLQSMIRSSITHFRLLNKISSNKVLMPANKRRHRRWRLIVVPSV